MTPRQRAETIVRLLHDSPSSAARLIEMHIAEAIEQERCRVLQKVRSWLPEQKGK